MERLVVEGIQPPSVDIANPHAPEPIALDNHPLTNRRQNGVYRCRKFIS
jgi:hypothetical protein